MRPSLDAIKQISILLVFLVLIFVRAFVLLRALLLEYGETATWVRICQTIDYKAWQDLGLTYRSFS